MIAHVRLACRILGVLLLAVGIDAHYDGVRYLPLPLVGIGVFLLIVGYGHDLLADEQARQLRAAQRRNGALAQLLADARRELLQAQPEKPPRRQPEPEVDDGRFAPTPPPAWTQVDLPPQSAELERLTQPWRTAIAPANPQTPPWRPLTWEQPPATENAAPANDGRPESEGSPEDVDHGGMPTRGAVPAATSTGSPATHLPATAEVYDYAVRLGVLADRPTWPLRAVSA